MSQSQVELEQSQNQKLVEPIHVEDSWKDRHGKIWFKVFLFDEGINNQGWGIDPQYALDNLKTGIGKPRIVTPDLWHLEEQLMLDVAGLSDRDVVNKLLEIQEPYAVSRYRKFYKDKDRPTRIYGNEQVTDDKVAEAVDQGFIPKFVSPAVWNLDGETKEERRKNRPRMKKFEFIHNATVKVPAYGYHQAFVRAKCEGSEQYCNSALEVASLPYNFSGKIEFRRKGIESADLEKGCGYCFGDKMREAAKSEKNNTSYYSENLNFASLDKMSEEDKSKKEEENGENPPNNEANKQTPEPQKSAKEAGQKTDNSAVKVITTGEEAKKQLQERSATQILEDKLAEQTAKFNEALKVLDEFKQQRTEEAKREREQLIRSYIKPQVFRGDEKKAEEEVQKYLGYDTLKNDQLIQILKDRFGDRPIELAVPVAAGKSGLEKAGIKNLKEYISNDANFSSPRISNNLEIASMGKKGLSFADIMRMDGGRA